MLAFAVAQMNRSVGVATTFTGITVPGTVFMVSFLLGLLREGAPSVCYSVAPVRRRPEEQRHLEVLRGIYADMDCRAPEDKRSDYYVKILENEGHAEECASGLVALDIRPVSIRLGWRSIWSGRDRIFHRHQFYLNGTNRKARNAGRVESAAY
jgi:hypothetical protein